jgi:hypothetical protein
MIKIGKCVIYFTPIKIIKYFMEEFIGDMFNRCYWSPTWKFDIKKIFLLYLTYLESLLFPHSEIDRNLIFVWIDSYCPLKIEYDLEKTYETFSSLLTKQENIVTVFITIHLLRHSWSDPSGERWQKFICSVSSSYCSSFFHLFRRINHDWVTYSVKNMIYSWSTPTNKLYKAENCDDRFPSLITHLNKYNFPSFIYYSCIYISYFTLNNVELYVLGRPLSLYQYIMI